LARTDDTILPILLRRPALVSFQFFCSHLFAFSFVPGVIGGFLGAKFLTSGIVRFVWVVPVAVLVVAFVFAPGMYPTAILDSDFALAFHYYFGGGFNFPAYSTYAELFRNFHEHFDLIRGYAQFRITVPAYAGVAYSLGASFSLLLKMSRTNRQRVSEMAL
jgi:hypothetical protein